MEESKISILIADDNKFWCNILKKYLSKFKSEFIIVGIANTNEEEIDLIEKFKPNVVITDILRSNNKNALDVIKRYSNKDNSPYFLIISGDDQAYTLKNNRELKICGYITKPILNYDLIRKNILYINYL